MITNYNSRSIKQIASGLYDAFKEYSSDSAPVIEAVTQFLEIVSEDYSYESIESFLQAECPEFYNWVTSSGVTETANNHFYSISVDIQGNQVLLYKDGSYESTLCRINPDNTVSFLDDYTELGQICSSLSASDTINEVNQWFCRSIAIGLQSGSSISDFIHRSLSDITNIRDEIKVYIADLSNYVDKYGVLNTIKVLQGGLENFVNSLKYENNQLSFTDNTGLIPNSWISGVINGVILVATQVVSLIVATVNPIIAVFVSLIGQGISYFLSYFDPNSDKYVVSFNNEADHNCFHIAFYQYIADIPVNLDGSLLHNIRNLLLTEGPCVFDVPGGNLWITAYDNTCSKACIEFHPILGITCCPPFSLDIKPASSSGHQPYTYYECVTAHNLTGNFTSVFDIIYDGNNHVYKFNSHQIPLNRFEEIYNDVVSTKPRDLELPSNSSVFWQLYNACAWFMIWRYLYNGLLNGVPISSTEYYDGMSLNLSKTFASRDEFLSKVGIGEFGISNVTLNNAENVIFALFRAVASKAAYFAYMPVKPFAMGMGDAGALSDIFNGNGSCDLLSKELSGLDLISNMQDLCWKGDAGIYSESTTFSYSDAIIALWSGFYGSYSGSGPNSNIWRYGVIAGYIIVKYISNALLDDNDNIIPGGLMILPKGHTFYIELPKYDFQSSMIQFIILASATMIISVVSAASAFKIRKAVNLRAAQRTAQIESLWSKVVEDPTNLSAVTNYNTAVRKWNLSYRWITGTKYNRFSYWGTDQGQAAGLLSQPMINKIGKLIDNKFE